MWLCVILLWMVFSMCDKPINSIMSHPSLPFLLILLVVMFLLLLCWLPSIVFSMLLVKGMGERTVFSFPKT